MRTPLLLLPTTLLWACAGEPEPPPERESPIVSQLHAIDEAIGRYQAQHHAFPPDIGPALVLSGHLPGVLEDPHKSGQTYGEVVTFGYEIGHGAHEDFYVVYSVGPDGVRSYEYDPLENRIVLSGDDELQTNLMVK